MLISTTPPDGGTSIAPGTIPTATFSAPPDVATATPNSLRLISTYSNATIPLSGVTYNGPTTLRLSPLDSLPRGTTVELRIEPTLTSGPANFAGQSIFFTTRAPTWAYPEAQLPALGTNDVTAAYDARGLAHVAWVNGSTVYVSEGGQTPTLLNFGSSSPAARVALGAAGAGKAVAAWVEGTTTRNVRASIFTGPWSSSVPIENFAENADAPDLAVEPTGNARVVWEQALPDAGVVVASACLIAGTWLPTEQLSASGRASQPHVGADSQGNTVIAWVEDGAVKARTGQLTGFLAAETTLAPSTTGADNLTLAMSTGGNAVLAWTGASGVTVAHFAAGQWTFTNQPMGTSPSVAIDETGVATAAWWDGTDNWAMRGNASGWSTPSRLNNAGRTTRPVRVASAGPVAVAVWMQLNTATPSSYVLVSSTFSFGTWKAPVSVAGARVNFPMTVVMGPRGDGLAVWQEQPLSGSPRFWFINLN